MISPISTLSIDLPTSTKLCITSILLCPFKNCCPHDGVTLTHCLWVESTNNWLVHTAHISCWWAIVLCHASVNAWKLPQLSLGPQKVFVDRDGPTRLFWSCKKQGRGDIVPPPKKYAGHTSHKLFTLLQWTKWRGLVGIATGNVKKHVKKNMYPNGQHLWVQMCALKSLLNVFALLASSLLVGVRWHCETSPEIRSSPASCQTTSSPGETQLSVLSVLSVAWGQNSSFFVSSPQI